MADTFRFNFKFDTKDDADKVYHILSDKPKTCEILEDLTRGLVLTASSYPRILSKIEELDPSDETQIRDQISKSGLFIDVDEGLALLSGSIKNLNSILDSNNICTYYVDVDYGQRTVKVETVQDAFNRTHREVEEVLNKIKPYMFSVNK